MLKEHVIVLRMEIFLQLKVAVISDGKQVIVQNKTRSSDTMASIFWVPLRKQQTSIWQDRVITDKVGKFYHQKYMMEICFERIIKQHRSHFSAVVTFADGNEDGFRAYRSSPDYHELRNASTQCNGLHLPIKVLQKKKVIILVHMREFTM